MLTNIRVKRLIVISLMFAFLCVGPLYAQASRRERPIREIEPPAKMTDEQLLKSNIGNFRMYLEPILKEEILKELTDSDSEYRTNKLGNWSTKPDNFTFEVEYSNVNYTNRKICIRFEEDFIIIWYHNSTSLTNGRSTSIDVVRSAVNDILGDEFIIGQDNTLAITRVRPSTEETELVMAPWPKEIPDTNAITCQYIGVDSKRSWDFVLTVSVLVEDKDAVVVMEKAKSRTNETSFIYQGLLAAKVRLSEEDAEAVKDKPVLARNVIFDEDVDTSEISDRLLNGCMWPIDDKAAVGVTDVGPACQLRSGEYKNEEDATENDANSFD